MRDPMQPRRHRFVALATRSPRLAAFIRRAERLLTPLALILGSALIVRALIHHFTA